MKRIFAGAVVALFSCCAFATTYVPIQLLNPVGCTSGQVIASTGPTTPFACTTVTLSGLGGLAKASNLSDVASVATARTNLGLGTAATATTGTSGATVPLLSTANTWTLAQAFTVRPAFNGATPWDSLNLSFGAPPAIGGTTPASGAFTALSASSNDALTYSNTAGQTIATATLVTVTTWTKIFDRVNANFNASTGVFTAPATGYYQISGMLNFASGTAAVAAQYSVVIVYNGVAGITQSVFQQSTSAVPVAVPFAAVISLAAGQTLLIQAFQSSGVSRTLQSGSASYISINRIP
jgi:hypothetical protein